MPKKPVVLIILDGWGYREEKENNAIAEANTPFFDYLWSNCPHSLLEASGLYVGLPDGQMGNSEVGHTTIGAGKAIDTDLVRISKAAERNEFSKIPAFQKLFEHIKKHNSTLHVKGMVSPGGVHSHHDHLFAFLRTAKEAGVEKIALHIFTDGRDTAPQSAHEYVRELENELLRLGVGVIASVSGRYYAMDRDKNWNRLHKAKEAIFNGSGLVCKNCTPSEVIKKLHAEGKTDEHFEPMVFVDENEKGFRVEKNDGIFFFNFRSDRARYFSQLIAEVAEDQNLCFVTMTEYQKGLPCLVAFEPTEIETTLAAEVSKAGLTQMHVAETEKYAHATFFLNGGREVPHDNEEHVLVESRKDIPTHDLAPEMKAKEVADKAIEHIHKGTDFVFINFANPDMVGHTAKKEAIVTALEVVDEQLKRVIEEINKVGGAALVTADHGNAEVNIDEQGRPHTAHTTNRVPAILIGVDKNMHNGSLQDIAPTILSLLDIPKPACMTGEPLTE